ncbi:hypothetical protein BGX29_007035 [Mortierella sp. GBA35]|nr:hypothetical protein BGX29_007035 [Mortierella sp. GBA35]
MDEKRIRGVQSKKSTLRSGRSSPPGYARGPQGVVIGIDRIEGEKKAAAAASWSSSDSTTVSSDIDEGRERNPQDHLKQEQLDRVLRLHRQQMEELQALLRRHMLDNSQLLAPHTLIDGDDDGGSEIGQGGRRDRISKKSSRTSSRKSSKDRRPGQSPQGHDSPMVQPDDFVRGPEEILQEPKLSLGRPSLATTGSLDGVEEAEIEEEMVDRMVYLRPEERSILVDCFEKINAHYERQFWIAENEVAHGHTKE